MKHAVVFTAILATLASLPTHAHEDHRPPVAVSAPALAAQTPSQQFFDRLKALEGEWIDVDGTFGEKGAVAVTYRVTARGNSVIETHFPGKRHEMTTVFHRDGPELALTHYCSVGNQPRMRARTVSADTALFEFDGGTNFDVATDRHMHNRSMTLTSGNEVSGEWDEWQGGRAEPRYHKAYRLQRKPAG